MKPELRVSNVVALALLVEMTWSAALLFTLFATLLTIVVGWLTLAGKVPIQPKLVFKDAGQRFMQVWIKLAIGLGIILPSLAWMIWIQDPEPRHILSLYLVVLLIQVVTEQIAGSIGLSGLVVTIGTLYTIFRLWQLWLGWHLVGIGSWNPLTQDLTIALLCLLGVFWFSNLIMLLTLGWSSVLRRD